MAQFRKTAQWRAFCEIKVATLRDQTGWLGREDSNLRMAESKSAALPLGYAPPNRGNARQLNRPGPGRNIAARLFSINEHAFCDPAGVYPSDFDSAIGIDPNTRVAELAKAPTRELPRKR
jgi:hypothetical protein